MNRTLSSMYEAANRLWLGYLSHGPGKTPQSLLDSFLKSQFEALASIDAYNLRNEVEEISVELEPLLRRCVERTEGLCFVTGEAGLIPRRDLHDRCEQLLDRLAALKN